MRRVGKTLLWAVAMAACSAMASCSLFETRDPLEPPPVASRCRPLTGGAVAAVVPNIEDSYGSVPDATCYNSLIDESFQFHPDPVDSAQALGQVPFPFAGWDDDVEKQVNLNVANLVDSVKVDFPSEYRPHVISPDQTTEVRFYDYVLLVSVGGVPDSVRYTGQADLTFLRGADGQWRVSNWVDHKGGDSDSSWGFLRWQSRP